MTQLPTYILLLVVVSSALIGACTDPPPPSLNGADRKLVDSLYRDSASFVRLELDSLCALRTPPLVAHLTDSLLGARLDERLRQLERLQKRPQ